MRTSLLHARFGVEIHDVDLTRVTAIEGYPEIRDAFERHSLLLFRQQRLDDVQHLNLAALFGPLEDRVKGPPRRRPPLPKVSNLTPGGQIASEFDHQVLNLKANQLWHTDSTFLPVPALANVIAARVVSSSGGETELVSTRVAWQEMPAGLKERARDAVLLHRYAHSRARIDPGLAAEEPFTMWPDQAWRAVWPNPVTGEDALYIASHAYAVAGMEAAAGQALIEELTAFATREQYVYSHRWTVGDVLIWDERATLHRGRPWPYEEERTLASICVSARGCDGFGFVQPPVSLADPVGDPPA